MLRRRPWEQKVAKRPMQTYFAACTAKRRRPNTWQAYSTELKSCCDGSAGRGGATTGQQEAIQVPRTLAAGDFQVSGPSVSQAKELRFVGTVSGPRRKHVASPLWKVGCRHLPKDVQHDVLADCATRWEQHVALRLGQRPTLHERKGVR